MREARYDGCVFSRPILTNKALLQGSDMLGVMPSNVARHYESAGELALLAVELPMPSGPVGIITRTAGATTDAQRDLLDALRVVAKAVRR